MWCSDGHGHWAGQHELEVHLVDLLQYVMAIIDLLEHS